MGEITDAMRRAGRDGESVTRSDPVADGAPAKQARREKDSASVSRARGLESREADPKAQVRASARFEEMPRSLLATRELVSLRDLVRVMFRRRLLMAIIFVMTLGSVTAVTFLMTPIYESTAILLIKLGREFMTEPGGGDLATPRDQVMKTEVEILRTNAVIGGAVADIGPLVLYPQLANSNGSDESSIAAAATRRFAGNLRVTALPDTQVARISFQHPDPGIAAKAVNLVVDHFMEMHLRAYGAIRATAFLEERVTAYRKKLDAESESVRVFLEKNGGFAIADIGDVVGRERRALASDLDSVRTEIAAARQEHAHLRKERAAMSKYEGADLQAALDAQIQKIAARSSALKAREATMRTHLLRYDEELAKLPALRKEYDTLVRDRDASNRLYRNYSRQLEEARISEEMDRQKIANIAVLQPGLVPSTPVHPRKTLNLAVGTMVAFGLAVLAALLVEATHARTN